jgi:hypothetical protein
MHHAHSIDRWDDATGSNLYEHLAGVNDPPPRAGRLRGRGQARWPGAKITLRRGALIIEKTWPAEQLSDSPRVLSSRCGQDGPAGYILARGAPGHSPQDGRGLCRCWYMRG